MSYRTLRRTGLVLAVFTTSTHLHAKTGDTFSDFGGIGLLQIPTARMAPDGTFAFTAGRAEPYSRYNIAWQVLPQAELTFRYTAITNRAYGPVSLSGDQSLKDKGVDIKVHLLDESFWIPAFAVGLRDVGGTSLFGSEYAIASKRWGNIDVSLGLGWGYLGSRGDLGNPLGLIHPAFKSREKRSVQGGKFADKAIFRGEQVSLIGGIEYQTPWQPLSLKLELDGNDYLHEPRNNNFGARYPVNAGANFRAFEALDLRLGWERGDTLMAGFTLHTNLSNTRQTKFDPEPLPVTQQPPAQPNPNWAATAQTLDKNAGLRVHTLERSGEELIVRGESARFRATPKMEGRAARVLAQAAPAEIKTFNITLESNGMDVLTTRIPRQSFVEAALYNTPAEQLEQAITPTASPVFKAGETETLYEDEPGRFRYMLKPGLTQSMGGPDAFYLYEIHADFVGEFFLTPSTWLSGTASMNLVDNMDKFRYTAPSELPRVRTLVREYITTKDAGITNLQLNQTVQFSDNWYGMLYGGLLETMFGGAGGEVLYRPLDSSLALGLNVSWAKQRGFERRFGFRDYQVITGHATTYWDTGWLGVKTSMGVGQYLAGDKGVTFAASREFKSGVVLGGWTTFTDAGSRYGEGSFDKGLYIGIPFDAFFTRSYRTYFNTAWQPLVRDGGAALGREYTLYQLTDDRDIGLYNLNRTKRLD